ncbi:MAG TPA: D-alanyl-D-alanine carboxypeptidase/D-alanyl-D-alanine-endopeptidase [Vicinamibacterales bacterium]|nr:D-alanyl-D-alanine carboxypeptidase/D-alanyl-D-alanine-endopeptidase [Vicinamibacterales bacterium]
MTRTADRCWSLVVLLLAAGCAQPSPTIAPPHDTRAARSLSSDLDNIFSAPVMEQGLWGVEVKSLDTGAVLYALNARKLMMPASNMKILTLAAAAETLGWDYRFKTVLERSAPVENGALEGDLVVVGTGDPTINSRGNRASSVFDEWAAALKTAGIHRIDGAIIGDDDQFDDVRLGQGWAWDNLEYGYAAPVGALEYNEDVAVLSIQPGAKPGDPAGLAITAGTGLTIVNRMVTAPPKSQTAIDFDRRPYGAVLVVKGSIASDAQPALRDVAVVNPTVYFVQALKDALIARGIAVSGDAVDVHDHPYATPKEGFPAFATSLSPPLRDIATVMMKVSQNLYAETLLKAVGAAKNGRGTADAGRSAARDIFQMWGIAPGGYVQMDGSGLSRYDYVTAEMVVTILEHMYRDPRHHEAFVATLPIAGKDGTIASRMKNTRAEGNALAKTGSIANVRALSGYVRTRDGQTVAFSMLANSFTIPAATVNWIADLAVETLSNYTSR